MLVLVPFYLGQLRHGGIPRRALRRLVGGPVVTSASVDSKVGFQISLSKSDELEIRRIVLS